MGFTRCYKTEVFLHLYGLTTDGRTDGWTIDQNT